MTDVTHDGGGGGTKPMTDVTHDGGGVVVGEQNP